MVLKTTLVVALFSIMVVAALATVTAAAVNAAVTAIQPSPDEKADSQADKNHIAQADNVCQKAGYDGYINGNCGYLP
jgi:hypothetical protein